MCLSINLYVHKWNILLLMSLSDSHWQLTWCYLLFSFYEGHNKLDFSFQYTGFMEKLI